MARQMVVFALIFIAFVGFAYAGGDSDSSSADVKPSADSPASTPSDNETASGVDAESPSSDAPSADCGSGASTTAKIYVSAGIGATAVNHHYDCHLQLIVNKNKKNDGHLTPNSA
ncbi:hypothetical protein QVD17_07016 [Tagetes erecta]|uniref:Uncharacterized protein n=1 Tax=Tagetes erecta TaxID=13708 RepID=A0AAD8LLS6_TARER|nr:hypothetical protein QVD17_07016 [Tagetes erecta]